jgi:hypothetical protein
VKRELKATLIELLLAEDELPLLLVVLLLIIPLLWLISRRCLLLTL